MIKAHVSISPCQVIDGGFVGDCFQADDIVESLLMTVDAANDRGLQELFDKGHEFATVTTTGPDIENYLPGKILHYHDIDGGLLAAKIISVAMSDDFVKADTTANLTLKRVK